MFKTKTVIVVAGVVGTLASSKQARDVTKAVGRYVVQKGLPAATGWVAHLRPSGGVLATDAGSPVVDLTQGFAAAVDRSIPLHVADDWMGRQVKVRIPAMSAAVSVAVIEESREVLGMDDTNPDGWEAALLQVETGMDGGERRWREPNFNQPTYRELETSEGAQRWAEVPGPMSPPLGMSAVQTVLPSPWPLGAEVPVADAPWEEVSLRRPRRFRPSWSAKQEAAIRRLHSHWRTDEGRAAVHIANDIEGLHDELTRAGRIGEIKWPLRGRTIVGFWKSARSLMSIWPGSPRTASPRTILEPSSLDGVG